MNTLFSLLIGASYLVLMMTLACLLLAAAVGVVVGAIFTVLWTVGQLT